MRERRDEARKLLAAGVDPGVKHKDGEKVAKADTFAAVAKEWLDLHRKKFFVGDSRESGVDV